MRISKSKTFKRVFSLVVLVVFTFTTYIALAECLQPVSFATYFNRDLKEIEDKEQPVDLLFVGASRVFRSYVPSVFEETLNLECVVNAGSSAQTLYATYYQLEDLIERVQPKKVVIGVTWEHLCKEQNLQADLIVYDRLSFEKKLEFALKCFGKENLLYAFSPYRFRNNIADISSIYKKKAKLKQTNYAVDTKGSNYYSDKGFVYFRKSCENGTIPMNGSSQWKKKKIKPENVAYLDACLELCKENNIEVVLVTGPLSMTKIYYINDYQMAFDYFTQYAAEKEIPYFNLNYLKNREEFLPDTMMADAGHVNGEGAYIISEIFAEILKKESMGIDTSDYFYQNLDELKADVHRIVSLKAEVIIDDAEGNLDIINIQSLQNEDMNAYYRVEVSVDAGETYVPLTDWTQESQIEVDLPETVPYKLKVSAKSSLVGDVEAYQIYEF